MLSTSSNVSKLLIHALSAHRYVVKMDRCRVVRVSGTLYGRVFCLLKMCGGLCVCLMNFNVLRIESDYELYNNAQIFCVHFLLFILQPCPVVFSHYQQRKSKLCRVVFLYLVVLAEQ